MGLLKHFRSRSKLKTEEKSNGQVYYPASPAPARDYIGRLPPKVVKKIFEYVCPHTLDQSYEASEKAEVSDGCMLCDLRDLARCAQTRRGWYQIAQELLYVTRSHSRMQPLTKPQLFERADRRGPLLRAGGVLTE
jgi:hypothetical protein